MTSSIIKHCVLNERLSLCLCAFWGLTRETWTMQLQLLSWLCHIWRLWMILKVNLGLQPSDFNGWSWFSMGIGAVNVLFIIAIWDAHVARGMAMKSSLKPLRSTLLSFWEQDHLFQRFPNGSNVGKQQDGFGWRHQFTSCFKKGLSCSSALANIEMHPYVPLVLSWTKNLPALFQLTRHLQRRLLSCCLIYLCQRLSEYERSRQPIGFWESIHWWICALLSVPLGQQNTLPNGCLQSRKRLAWSEQVFQPN